MGLIESSSDILLKYTVWDGSSWSQLATIGATITTRAQPSTSGSAGTPSAQAVFHGADYKFYAQTYNALWTFDGAVGSPQQYGPVAPVIVARGADATVAFINGLNNKATCIDRVGGVWQSPADISSEVTNFNVRPTLVAMASGPELMAMWQASSGNQVRYSTRTGGVWSAAADAQYATSFDPVAMVALPKGDVLMAWRGTDGKLYFTEYAASTGIWANPWGPGYTLIGSPALARGVGLASAEVAFVGTDHVAYHCRMIGGVCPNPVPVGSNVDFVSITTAP